MLLLSMGNPLNARDGMAVDILLEAGVNCQVPFATFPCISLVTAWHFLGLLRSVYLSGQY